LTLVAAKKEAKRLEKEAKLAAKAAKNVGVPASEKKVKGEKDRRDEDVPFVNTTPKGEKKGGGLPAITLYTTYLTTM
jgi:valyl-tRNA synthetase